jgi:hypothetical protein
MNSEHIGDWYFIAYLGVSGQWYGLAKQEPFVNGHPIFEPGEVWFELGETYDTALAAIKKSVLQ